MRKQYVNTGCYDCYEAYRDSTNVEVNTYITDFDEKMNESNTVLDFNKIRKCECKECGNKYEFCSKQRYIRHYKINETEEISELVAYESEDGKDFRLVKIRGCKFDTNRQGKEEPVYLLFYEDAPFPIRLTEETAKIIVKEVDDVIETQKEPEVAKDIIYKKLDERYRKNV